MHASKEILAIAIFCVTYLLFLDYARYGIPVTILTTVAGILILMWMG